jgi:hypothetical protein
MRKNGRKSPSGEVADLERQRSVLQIAHFDYSRVLLRGNSCSSDAE